MTLTFHVPGPVGWKQRPRCACIKGHPRLYTPKPTTDWEARVKAAALRACAAPLTGAVEVRLHFLLTPPASWSKRKKAAALVGLILPTSRPDLDNSAKAILDALNEVAYADDTQIADLHATRRYAEAEGVTVEVLQIQIEQEDAA